MLKKYSMNREWKFHLGDVKVPLPRIHEEAYAQSKAGGAAGAGGMSCDDIGWQTVDLPHDWELFTDFDSKKSGPSQGYKQRGIAWYRKSFYIPAEHKDKHIELVFGGVATECEIYLNGSVLKRNYSGLNEFAVDISDRAFFGDKPNVLAVRVDADKFEGWWYEGAGIYRNVWLTVSDMLHIAYNGLWINPVKKKDGEWTVRLEATVENRYYTEEEFELTAEITRKGESIARACKKAEIQAVSEEKAKLELCVKDPELWDTDSPELYEMHCRIVKKGETVDEVTESFGFRTIEFTADKGFFLNGKNIKLKGVCCHEDHAGVGTAIPESIYEFRVSKLKELGCNAYRCSHGAPSREFLDICDRMGLLVLDENRRFESADYVLDMLREQIIRDRNHPCVFMYALFNEEPLQGSEEGKKMFLRMRAEVKRLDPTRPTTGAMNGGVTNDAGSSAAMDVVGINYNIGIYDKFRELYPDTCVMGSENVSTLSVRGCYLTDDEKQVKNCFDEERPPWGRSVRETWKAVNERDFVAGEFVWTGFDYRGEPTPYRWPTVSSLFGLYDTCGFPKDAAYFQKACWDSEPMVHILPHWNHKDGETVRVMTVTNCDEVELFLNGKTLGRRSSNPYDQNEWQVVFEKGTISAVGYINGIPAARTENKTAGKTDALKVEPHKGYIFNDGADAVAVNISAVDKNGTAVPAENRKVKITVTGGRVLGTGNGDPNSHEADYLPERHLFIGLCQALIAADEGAISVSVTVSAEGLEDVSTELEVRKNENAPEYIYSVKDIPVGGWRMTVGTSKEKPDSAIRLADNDMNSFEPVIFDDEFQSDFTEGYKLYLTKLNVPIKGKYSLVFKTISGYEAEFYINGEQVFNGVFGGGQRGTVISLDGINGEIRLAVCIKASTYTPTSGIKGTVCLRAE